MKKNTLLLSSLDIARALRAIFEEAKMKSRKGVFSIPDFSSFFTNFELPPMSKSELAEAVQFEARKHVPLPISEVTFDWQLLEKRFDASRPSHVLLVAVPNETIAQYQEIAKAAKVQMLGLEAEVFGIIRSCLKGEKIPAVVLDIGAQSTTVSVVDKGMLWNSHSVDIGGNAFTERVAQALSLAYDKAEEEKMAKGMKNSEKISQILGPLVDILVIETEKMIGSFLTREKKEIQKVLLGGGSSRLVMLPEYFAKALSKPVEVMNPFSTIYYPPILEYKIKEMGPSYAVAVGMAQKQVQ